VIATVAKGYYITFENDTVNVDFTGAYIGSEPNAKHYTWSAVYLDNEGKKTLLSPKTAREIFWITDSNDTNRMVSILNKAKLASPPDKSGLRFFANVVIENEKLNLYIFHTYNGPLQLPTNSEVSRFVLVKENGDMLETGYLGDRKRMKIFLADCPEVITCLKEKCDKTYLGIVKMYNSSCGANKENIIKE
jgi:hypothetical protein